MSRHFSISSKGIKGDDTVELGLVPSTKTGEVDGGPAALTNDAVFGAITEDGPNYRNVSTSQYR